MSDVEDIVTHNKTLQQMVVHNINGESAIDAVRTLVRAIRGNTTLQRIKLHIAGIGESDEAVSAYMETHHKDLTLDTRIEFVN